MKELECPQRVSEAFSRMQVGDALRAVALKNLARWLGEDAFTDADGFAGTGTRLDTQRDHQPPVAQLDHSTLVSNVVVW